VSAVTTLRQAVATIPDGARCTLGGFQLNRAPMALLFELLRQERRDLRIVTLPNPLALDLLVGAGRVAEAEFGFLGFQYEGGFVTAPHVKRRIESGTLPFKERDVYEIVQGFRAGAAGLPFVPAPGLEGSEYMRVNRTPMTADPSSGAQVPVAAAIRPDVALVHAQIADRKGNLAIDDLYAEDLLARASRRVVATAERIVERLESPTIPHVLVDAVAEVPGGAFPTSCHGFYRYSAAHLRDYLAAALEGRFANYLERFVTGTPDQAAFLRLCGGVGARDDVADAPAAAGTGGASPGAPGAADRLVIELARAISDGDVVATGVASALPMLAVAVARATHAPRLTYINCVGAVNPEIRAATPTSVDTRLLLSCEARIGLPDMFDLARCGRIDLMFFGAAQVDAEGRTNLTCIGEFARPRVKLPGPAGSSSMRSFVPKVVIFVPRHSLRSLPARVDFATTVPSPRNRSTRVVTDQARFDLAGGRLVLVSRPQAITLEDLRDRTGFRIEGDAEIAPEPTAAERQALDRLDPEGIRHRMI
jgi:glutaconate CoA-transferase, subunit A